MLSFPKCINTILIVLLTYSYIQAQSQIRDSTAVHELNEVEIISSWAGDRSPVTQKTILKDQLHTENGTDIPVLLSSTVSSLSTSDAGNGIGYTYLRIRGTDQTRINVNIDGVPVNDAESQNVFWVDLPDMVQDARAIQIQRGVGISSFGPGAFGANINIQTEAPLDRFGIESQIGAGSFHSQKYNLAINSGSLGRFKFRVRGSHIHSDGYLDRAFSNLYSTSLQMMYEAGKTSFQASVYYGKEKTYQAWNGTPYFYYQHGDKTYNPSGIKSDGTFFDDETDNYVQVYSRFIVKHKFSQHSSLQATLYHTYGTGYYNQYKNEQDLNEYFDGINLNSDLIRERWLRNNLLGIQANYKLISGTLTHQVGMNIQKYYGRHFGIVRQVLNNPDWAARNYYDNDADKAEESIFYNLTYANGKWNFLGDVQLRHLDYIYQGIEENGDLGTQSADFLFFNPKLGITYHHTNHLNIYAFAGIGNKEPNRDDFTDSPFNNKPRNEHLLNCEAGLRYEKNNFAAQGNLYWMKYKDQLVLTGEINDVGAYTRTNVARSYRTGIELELSYAINQWMSLKANATFSKNKINAINEYLDVSTDTSGGTEYLPQVVIYHKNTDIAYSPDIISYGEITATPFLWTRSIISTIKFSYTVKYVGVQYLNNFSNPTSKLSEYNIHNLRITWPLTIGKHQININAFINNIWNKSVVSNGWVYRFKHISDTPIPEVYDTRSEGNNYYSSIGLFPEAGRNFFLTLSYSF